MRLLIVEDDPYFGSSVLRQLRRELCRPVLVRSLECALEVLDAAPFDAVLSDQHLAEANGLDFLDSLGPRFPGMRRVLMSGGEVEGWCGIADAVIEKPFTLSELRAALRMRDTDVRLAA